MLLLEGYISNFTCARYYFLYVEFSDFFVNQSLARQTLHIIFIIFIFTYYIKLSLNNVLLAAFKFR
jgi:hypothetical protein